MDESRFDVHATISSEDLLITLYILLLNRLPDQSDIKCHMECMPDNGSWHNIITALLSSEERNELIRINPAYSCQKLQYDIHNIISCLNCFGVDKNLLNIVISELLLNINDVKSALDIFIGTECFEFWNTNTRFLYIAKNYNFLQYTWLLHRLLSIFGEKILIKNGIFSSEFIFTYINDGIMSNNETISIYKNNMISADMIVTDLIESNMLQDIKNSRKNLLISCELRRLPKDITALCMEIFDIIMKTKAAPLDYKYMLHRQKKLLLVCGCVHSGSSALYDYLQDSQECSDTFSKKKYPFTWEKEVAWFQFPYSLYDAIKSSNESSSYTIGLMRFFLVHVLAFFFPTDIFLHYSRNCFMLGTAFMRTDDLYISYLNIFKEFFLNINYFKLMKMDIQYIRCCIYNLFFSLDELIGDKNREFILLNNPIVCDVCDRLEIFPNGTAYILFTRDPRDQFISLNKICNFSVNDYVARRSFQISQFQHAYSMLRESYNIIPASYERFVFEDDYRQRLCKSIGLQNEVFPKKFNPEISKKSIGKYINFHDQDSIKAVTAQFPKLIDNSWLKQFHSNIE